MIEFDKNFFCNINVIDEQHKILFEIINKLERDLNHKCTEVEDIIIELEEYSNYHFATEEAFWEHNDKEEIRKHVEQHKEFVELVNNFKNENNNMDRYEEMLLFLQEWIKTHIKVEDKKMFSKNLNSIKYN